MKKLLMITFAVLLCMGTAGATDVTLSGSYFARGTWVDNWNGDKNDAVDGTKNQFGVYDHELSLDMDIDISADTKIFSRIEIRDEDWGVASNPTEGALPAGAETDDNIYIEQIWGQHLFTSTRSVVRAGLMRGNSLAGDFGSEGGEGYVVFFGKKTENFGGFGFDVMKGPGGAETLEAEADLDVYSLTWKHYVSDTRLIGYFQQWRAGHMDATVAGFSATGQFSDNLGFDSEIMYMAFDFEDEMPAFKMVDYEVYGFYGQIWAQVGALKITGEIAHGSFDDDAKVGFAFGDVFDGANAILLGDEVRLYDSFDIDGDGPHVGRSYNDLQGATLLVAKLSYDATEKLNLNAYFGYATSNVDEVASKYDGATAWEVHVKADYKITPNVTYTAAAATAQVEYGSAGGVDPDRAVEIFHRLSFNF